LQDFVSLIFWFFFCSFFLFTCWWGFLKEEVFIGSFLDINCFLGGFIMKKIACLFGIIAMVLCFSSPVLADSASGNVEIHGLRYAGNPGTGAVVAVDGGAGYFGAGQFYAAGFADGDAVLGAGAFNTPNFAVSGSGAVLALDANAVGIFGPTGVMMGGQINQSSWANVGSPNTFASAGEQVNVMGASFDGGFIASYDNAQMGAAGGSVAWQSNGWFTSQAGASTNSAGGVNADIGFVTTDGGAATGAQRVGFTGVGVAQSQSEYSAMGFNGAVGGANSYSRVTLIEGPGITVISAHTNSSAGSLGF
jgi:hypothetical protein